MSNDINHSVQQLNSPKHKITEQEITHHKENEFKHKSVQIPNKIPNALNSLHSNDKHIPSPSLQLSFLKEAIIKHKSNDPSTKPQSSTILTENKRYAQFDKLNNSIKQAISQDKPQEANELQADSQLHLALDYRDDDLKRLKQIKNPYDSVDVAHKATKDVSAINYEISPLKTPQETIKEQQLKHNIRLLNDIMPHTRIRTHRTNLNGINEIDSVRKPIDNKSQCSSPFRIQYAQNDNQHQEGEDGNNTSQSNDLSHIHIEVIDSPHEEALIADSIRFSSISKENFLQMPQLVCQYRENEQIESKEEVKKRKDAIFKDTPYSTHPFLELSKLPQDKAYTPLQQQSPEDNIALTEERKVEKCVLNESNSLVYGIGRAAPLVKLRYYHLKDGKPDYTTALDSLEKEISLSRTVLCDGDGFYRSIAFALIENYIKENSIDGIKELRLNISSASDISFSSHNTLFNKTVIISVLDVIIAELSSGNALKAYKVLILAFVFEPLLQLGLIKYIKMRIACYIASNQALLSNYISEHKVISMNYIRNGSLARGEYITNEVLCMNHAPDQLIISLTAQAMSINIVFYYLEPHRLFKQTLTGNNNSSFIHLIASNARYEIGYPIQEYFNDLDHYYVQSQYSPSTSLKAIRQEVKCDICKNLSTEIVLRNSNSQEYPLCKQCLMDSIKSAMLKRASFLIEDQYNHLEFYSQPISLTKEGGLNINDEDMLLLFGMTIPQYLHSLLLVGCVVCDMALEKPEDKVQLKCGCSYCLTCIRNKVMVDTQHLIVLNKFERMQRKYQDNKPKCHCLKEYEPSLELNAIFPQERERYQAKANERFTQLMHKACCICSTEASKKHYLPIISTGNDSEDSVNGKKKILTHIICQKCKSIQDAKHKENKSQALLNQCSSSSAKPRFHCVFCNESHEYIAQPPEEGSKQKYCLSKCCLIV